MNQPQSIAMGPFQAIGDVLLVVWRHTWRMMTLRPQGEELDRVSQKTRLALIALGGLAVALCTYFAPADDRLRAAFSCLLISALLALLVSRGSGGAQRVTGLAILFAGTEPLGLALRWTPGFEALDHVLSLWFVVAIAVFFLRNRPGDLSSDS